MGRKSVADIRREEILDAFETCINTHGFHASSTRRIAAIAGIKQPLIAHYFGNKAAMVQALVARIEGHYIDRLTDVLGAARGRQRLKRALDFLFGPEVLGEGPREVALGQLLAAARYDEALRSRIIEMYTNFLTLCAAELQRAFPSAVTLKCREVAYGVLSLGVGNDVLVSMGLKFANRRLARQCAEQMIAGLQKTD